MIFFGQTWIHRPQPLQASVLILTNAKTIPPFPALLRAWLPGWAAWVYYISIHSATQGILTGMENAKPATAFTMMSEYAKMPLEF